MKYSIWIVKSPKDLGWYTRCFDEVALGLQAAFRLLGVQAPIVYSSAEVVGTAIVLAPHLLAEITEKLPENMILYNFEQIHAHSMWMRPEFRYLEFLKQYPVFDYSGHNIDTLRKKGVERITTLGLGYVPALSRIPQLHEDIDIVFVGAHHERRQHILDALQKRGLKVAWLMNEYGPARDGIVARAKIVLNIHQYPAQLFEIVRVSYMLANHKCVISETGNDSLLEQPFKEAVKFVPYDELVETCLDYLAKSSKRRAQGEKGFEVFSHIQQAPMLKQALGELGMELPHGAAQFQEEELPKIFVNMASYRDPECHHTITDLFEKATHPERIFVGVCWQFDADVDGDYLAVDYPRKNQVRVLKYDITEALGSSWARAQAQTLCQGERYTLQIQAHMRFEPGWDDTLIQLLQRCPAQKPALTAWLPAYVPPNKKSNNETEIPATIVDRLGEAYDPQMVHLGWHMVDKDKVLGKLLPTCSWVGNFLFMRSEAFAEVPIDPHIYFWGEEINHSARLWTSGYDFFHLDRVVLYHFWCRPDVKDQDIYRDYEDPRNMRSLARNRHLFGLETSADEEAIRDIERYPLGNVRRLNDYWKFYGIDLLHRTIAPKAKKGSWFVPRRLTIKRPKNNAPRIFIAIASYRDAELKHTIRNALDMAAKPERISVGVCLQNDPKDSDCGIGMSPNDAIRVVEYDYRQSKGANWARAQAHSLYMGEDYVLQIDAHMRFEAGWDETLIMLLARCPSEKSVLTAWVPGYELPNQKQALGSELPMLIVSRLGAPDDAQLVHLLKRMVPAAKLYDQIIPVGSIVANCVFMRGSALQEVPFDPHIFFWGDEINQSARLWTHGYDLYHLDRPVIYHHWALVRNKPYHERKSEQNRLSLLRNRHVLQLEISNDKEALVEVERYPLGKVRSIEDYWEFAGIDLKKRAISRDAHHGKWGTTKKPETRAVAANILPRIFVIIPAYCDTELQWTLKDLFEKAKHPERIFAGICLQYAREDERSLEQVPMSRRAQLRIMEVPAAQTKGANWARNQAWQRWEGEEFTLQIDSHTRFEPNWDDYLIETIARCPAPPGKAVLTAFLRDYQPGKPLADTSKHFVGLRVREITVGKHPQPMHVTGYNVARADMKDEPVPSAVLAAGFIFAHSHAFKESPPDPHLYFYGDELSMATRLWTRGYDFFQPPKVVALHRWKPAEISRNLDYKSQRKNAQAQARLLHMFGLRKTDNKQALTEIEQYNIGTERSIEEYWRYCGVDLLKNSATDDAKKGQWLRYKPAGARPRIFVQIASYRDPDCQNTVKSIFEKAKHPERIFVGICWQFIKEEDAHCFVTPYPRPKQVRVMEVDARQSKGVCWARHQLQKLWGGEEFTLQIDSHMRFEQDWDETLLSMWNDCHNEKALLTCYPPGFTPPDNFETQWIYGMAAREFDGNGILLMHGMPAIPMEHLPPAPIAGAYVSGCMLFGPASMIHDVPYDPYLYFFGEEVSLGVRLWTHGYDIYHPNKRIVFHDWKRDKRRTHFDDHDSWQRQNESAFARVKHLLKTAPSNDPEVTRELDIYGLGKVRSLEDYQDYSGVNFVELSINEQAKSGIYEPPQAPHKTNGSFMIKKAKADKPRIYVQIASYRDRECQWTVKDLFEKAADPDRINVGICWQFDEKDDLDCFQISTRPDQVRILPVDWREADGVCWARNQTQQLWDGEEYNLQIDAHMRFVPEWDKLMIQELAACEADKPVLTCSPASYTPPNKLQRNPRPTIRRVMPFTPEGNIRGKGESIDRMPAKPLNGAFVAGGFVFSRSNIIAEVPYDPYLYFDQEEITYAARLYTHGWDVHSSRRPLLYHYYNESAQSVRPLHWRDLNKEHTDKVEFLRNRGLNRFNHITGYAMSNDVEVTRDLSLYCMGKARSLKQFEDYVGIDFKRKLATEKALRCLFIRDLDKYRDTPVHVPEVDGPVPPTAAQLKKTSSQLPTFSNLPKLVAADVQMLEVGDFMPFFRARDTHHQLHGIEANGGKHSMVVFLSAHHEDYLKQFFATFQNELKHRGDMQLWMMFILDASVDALLLLKDKLNIPYALWSDADRRISQSFGLIKPGAEAVPPVGFVLNQNIKIIASHSVLAPDKLAKQLLDDAAIAIESRQQKYQTSQVITELPPALIVPDVFSPEFCARCIEAFRTGHTFEGTVGAEEKLAYRPNTKKRIDHIVSGKLLDAIDEKLSRSLFPEIAKVFGFEVKHRELYKIGCYTGEQGGFFKQHRDNFDAPLGYRRIAMTLHLNDEYEGGGLRFPEYDEHIYRPHVGSAITFSCSTLHEARPVTKGERFVLVGFFHGEMDEAYRRHYLTAKNKPLKIKSYQPRLVDYSALNVNRSFYSDWMKNNVSYHNENVENDSAQPALKSKAPAIIHTIGGHQPRKVLETKQGIVFDDFLPENIYESIRDFAVKTDYQRINSDKISRAWHLQDGQPLRSEMNLFYYAEGAEKPAGHYVYPTKTALDPFVDHLLAMQPYVEHMVGKEAADWWHTSVTAWLYPAGTGLAMHDDGSGVYTGAYVYFLNPHWRPHWGGLLVLMDDESNKTVYDYRNQTDQSEYYRRHWLHENRNDELLMEQGLGQCIFPKRNRIVFIANEAYHMVTRVNEASGDNIRMSLAGFYNRKKSSDKKDDGHY